MLRWHQSSTRFSICFVCSDCVELRLVSWAKGFLLIMYVCSNTAKLQGHMRICVCEDIDQK